jgi:drug/metabolite transporter (DMT)-like permease
MSGKAESGAAAPDGGTLLLGLAWGLGGVVVWSGSFVLTRLGVKTTLTAYDIIALRYGVGALLLLPVLMKHGLALDRLGWRGLLMLVAGGGAPYALISAIGMSYAPASQAGALIPGMMTVMVAMLGVVLWRDRPPAQAWWGVGAILVGSLMIGWWSSQPGQGPGHVAFVFAALLWAGYVLILRRARLPALHAASLSAILSAAAYLPVYLLFLPNNLSTAPFADVALQAGYQGVLTTVFGLLAFNRAVALLGAAAGASLSALIPLITMVLAALLLAEIPQPHDVVAALLIAAGVVLLTASRPKAPSRTLNA